MTSSSRTSVAFVTVSYAPDRDRCALLQRSLKALAPLAEHWIVVDRADLRHFSDLQDPRTTILTTEDVLPIRMRRVGLRSLGLRSNMWVHGRGKPVRGWLVQQLAKLAIVRELDSDVVVHTDSDVALVRPFDESTLVDSQQRVRLYVQPEAVDERLPKHVVWHRSAESLLGLSAAPVPLPDFITSLVPWRRENALQLIDHIERTTGRHWVRALASAWDVSEYILYGRFVRDVLRDEGQVATSDSLCLDYWTSAPLSPPELEAFLDRLEPGQIGVSITAKAGMRPSEYESVLRRRWSLAEGASPQTSDS